MLVTDFDGTLTYHDFYHIAKQRLLPRNWKNPFVAYQKGELTHFQAMQRFFEQINTSEAEILAVLQEVEIEPKLAEWVTRLRSGGWEVMITSAGCAWYIERILASANVDVEVHASPGRFVPYQGLFMEEAKHSPYFCPSAGIDKASAVRAALSQGVPVAYAGDGPSDLEAALLVPPALRFARIELATMLDDLGEAYQPFTRWGEVAESLSRYPLP